MSNKPLAYIGVDESGSLADETEWFSLAGVLTYRPEAVRHIIRRVATRSGKRLQRKRAAVSEFKWRNASGKFRQEVLARLAEAEVEVFSLMVRKGRRRIEDTPEHYAALICELLRDCWVTHPNLALLIDKRFASPMQVGILNTLIYRQLPASGVLSISHVDSQRHALVQLADFVAGSIYAKYKEGDTTSQLLASKLRSEKKREWAVVKREWLQQ